MCQQVDCGVINLRRHWLSSLLRAPAWLPLIQAASGVHVHSVCLLICFGPVATWGMSSSGGSLDSQTVWANTGASWALTRDSHPHSINQAHCQWSGENIVGHSSRKKSRVTSKGLEERCKARGRENPSITVTSPISGQFLQPEKKGIGPADHSRVPSEAEIMIQRLALIEGLWLTRSSAPKPVLGNPAMQRALSTQDSAFHLRREPNSLELELGRN